MNFRLVYFLSWFSVSIIILLTLGPNNFYSHTSVTSYFSQSSESGPSPSSISQNHSYFHIYQYFDSVTHFFLSSVIPIYFVGIFGEGIGLNCINFWRRRGTTEEEEKKIGSRELMDDETVFWVSNWQKIILIFCIVN